MINEVARNIKSYLAQHTNLFDLSSVEVTAKAQNNFILIEGLDGEYTLSGASDGVASAGCINTTHEFTGGYTETNCYFGDHMVTHKVLARRLNVGTAFKRSVALEALKVNEEDNAIIVYAGSTKNQNTTKGIMGGSEDRSFKAVRTIGVMFKADSKIIDDVGCTEYDKLFINSVIGTRKSYSSLIEFNSIIDRFHAQESYIVDIEFGYIDQMFLDEAFLSKIKHFEAFVDSPNI